ncbi:MAG: tRNA (adenosine(37)-N6)-threonylcarbamoyltransferase complex transferase subunit TsaD, partial [Chloroflexota bacterium]
PGLVGSLLVGVNMAKGLSLATGKPLLGINHIEGHVYSQWLADGADEIELPIVCLVVSGGHTELYLMEDHCTYKHLGGTLDDAAGEAFDKVGRLLGLPYPGGPHIDRAAKQGDPTLFEFPRAVMKDGYNFSFSGLKTAAMREIQRFEKSGEELPLHDLAAGFQQAVVDVLVIKTGRAVKETGAKGVHISGGVSANSQLRREMAERLDVPVRTPPLFLCTDNAAMIGAAAHQHFTRGERSSADMDVSPSLQIG